MNIYDNKTKNFPQKGIWRLAKKIFSSLFVKLNKVFSRAKLCLSGDIRSQSSRFNKLFLLVFGEK